MHIGQSYVFNYRVTESDTCALTATDQVKVLSTPQIVALMEHSARELLQPALVDGEALIVQTSILSVISPVSLGAELIIEASFQGVLHGLYETDISISDLAGVVERAQLVLSPGNTKDYYQAALKRQRGISAV